MAGASALMTLALIPAGANAGATRARAAAGMSTELQGPKEDDLPTAHMNWSTESVPVAVGANGAARSIASSVPGKTQALDPDLNSVFIKEFSLETAPEQALIRLFAYTRYPLYVNGVYLGRGPSRFQNQRPEYDTWEIGKAPHAGMNRIAVLVRRDSPTGRIMRHDPGFAAVIELKFPSGKRTIATDSTWLSKPGLSFGSRAVRDGGPKAGWRGAGADPIGLEANGRFTLADELGTTLEQAWFEGTHLWHRSGLLPDRIRTGSTPSGQRQRQVDPDRAALRRSCACGRRGGDGVRSAADEVVESCRW